VIFVVGPRPVMVVPLGGLQGVPLGGLVVMPLRGPIVPIGGLKVPLGGPTAVFGHPTNTQCESPSFCSRLSCLLELSRLPWRLKNPYGQMILLILLSPQSVLGLLMTETLSLDAR
jgi:hypothetical protein